MRKYLLTGLIFLILGLAGAYGYSLLSKPYDKTRTNGDYTYVWHILNTGVRASDWAPSNSISLDVIRKGDGWAPVTYPLMHGYISDDYIGHCARIEETSELPMLGEISGVICAYKKEIVEVGVFKSGGEVYIEELNRLGSSPSAPLGYRDEASMRILRTIDAN